MEHETALAQGKRDELKGFPKDHPVQLFWVRVSAHRTTSVVTSDLVQDSAAVTQQAGSLCGTIER